MPITENFRVREDSRLARLFAVCVRSTAAAFIAAALSLVFRSGAEAQIPQQPAEIVMPSRLVEGEPATLAVLDAAGSLVPHTAINFSDGSHTETDVTGHAFLTAPLTPNALIAKVTLRPEIMAYTVVLPHSTPDRAEILSVPPLVSIHDPFEVKGSGFRGDASSNHVTFHGEPVVVLASSPAALVILLDPKSVPGNGSLTITSNGPEVSSGLTALAVEFTLEADRIVPGMKTKLTVRVRGTDRPEDLDVENFAPEVLRYANVDSEPIRTRGGADNSAVLEVRALHAGDFSFRARILSEAGVPDVAEAHEYLEAAQIIASPQWKRRLDPVIARLEQPKPNVKQVVDEVGKLIPEAPQGDFAIFLSAARNALRGH
jgi:IPT/TIG domain-containing protein